MSLPDYETLKARYARGFGLARPTEQARSTYTVEWPKPLTHEDLDPLLRAALRAERERKATAALFNKKFNRAMSRRK